MSLAFADRDFYYGDPAFPPEEPMKGLLSKEYAKARFAQINWTRNDSTVKPGDPYPFQGGTNPFASCSPSGRYRFPTQRDSGQQDRRPGRRRTDSAFRAQFYCGHDVDRGGRRAGLGRVGHAERRLGPRGDRRARPASG